MVERDANTPSAGFGHNSGADPYSDELMMEAARASIDNRLDKLEPRLRQLIESAGRAAVTDRESAGKVTDLIGMFQNIHQRIDAAHSEAKRPWLEAGRVVDGRTNAMRDRADVPMAQLNEQLTTWQRAEMKRIEDLRAAERAAEAADPEPTAESHAAVDAQRATVRSDLGATARLKDSLVIDSVDVKKLPKAFLMRPKIMAVIEAEAKVLIRAGEKVNGVSHSKAARSSVRKGG